MSVGRAKLRQSQDRAARRARNLALAYWIDGLVRSGEVADLAAVARMCGVSRARVSAIVALLEQAGEQQERALVNSLISSPPACQTGPANLGQSFSQFPKQDFADGGALIP